MDINNVERLHARLVTSGVQQVFQKYMLTCPDAYIQYTSPGYRHLNLQIAREIAPLLGSDYRRLDASTRKMGLPSIIDIALMAHYSHSLEPLYPISDSLILWSASL